MNREAIVVKLKQIMGMLIIALVAGFGCGSGVEEATPSPADEPQVVVEQVTLGGSTLTVEELFFDGDSLAMVVTLHNQPGSDPRVMMPWYLEDEEGNVYPSRHTEMYAEEVEFGDKRWLTVYFPDGPEEWESLALEAWIRHENWQVSEDSEGTMEFTLTDVEIQGNPVTQTLGGLTAEASAVVEDGALNVEVSLSVMDVAFWEALRQPALRVVDANGEEYTPDLSQSTTNPVGPGEAPVSSAVHWHYTINEWPADQRVLTMYYEIKGTIAPPKAQAANFYGLTLNPVE